MFTAGPTPLPSCVRKSLSSPLIHHRTAKFGALLKEVTQGLKYIFQTKNDVYIFASSATGMMETAVANLLSSGDEALVIDAGIWGRIWTEICKVYGIRYRVINVAWGKQLNPEIIREKLKESAQIKAVFATLCETSTGVVFDIQTMGKIIKDTPAVFVVDAASGLGAVEFKTDEWFCDVVIAGSQKGLMLPPGLGFISVSKKAQRIIDASTSPKYYFDLKKAKDAYEKKNQTPFTPAISLIIALKEVLTWIKKLSLEKIFLKNKKNAESLWSGLKALGLEIFSSSPILTTIQTPAGIDTETLVTTLQDKYNIKIARGLGELADKTFRIGTIGNIESADIIIVIDCLEKTLHTMGYKCVLGSGVNAAKKALNQ